MNKWVYCCIFCRWTSIVKYHVRGWENW